VETGIDKEKVVSFLIKIQLLAQEFHSDMKQIFLREIPDDELQVQTTAVHNPKLESGIEETHGTATKSEKEEQMLVPSNITAESLKEIFEEQTKSVRFDKEIDSDKEDQKKKEEKRFHHRKSSSSSATEEPPKMEPVVKETPKKEQQNFDHAPLSYTFFQMNDQIAKHSAQKNSELTTILEIVKDMLGNNTESKTFHEESGTTANNFLLELSPSSLLHLHFPKLDHTTLL